MILVDFIQIYFFEISKISTLILMLLIIQVLLKIQESSCQETQFGPPINFFEFFFANGKNEKSYDQRK